MNKKIAIVTGEPNSINTEIIAKSWKVITKNQKKKIFLIGNYLLIKKQLKKLRIKVPIRKIENIHNKINGNYLQILDVPLKFTSVFRVSKNETSKYVLKSLDLAHHMSKNKIIKGFINCPINKKNTFKKKNIGVTEFLAKKNKVSGKEVMLIFNKKISVTPITTHIELKDVAKKVKKIFLKNKILNLNKGYFTVFKKKPSIAVLGLNPHNSEFKRSSEEKREIIPTINLLRQMKIKVSGPYSSDSFFSKQGIDKYDVAIGMYHDQVLTPFKALFRFDAFNLTLGLGYLRISPDHGVAEDIIGRGKANPLSLIRSINFITKI